VSCSSGTAASSSSAAMRRPRHRRLRWWSELGAVGIALQPGLMLGACGDLDTRHTPLTRFARAAAPEMERPGQLCADFGEHRVCYADGSAARVQRPLPAGLAPPEGYRCGDAGGARSCEDRAAHSGAFECGTTRCLQLRPRMPDDGEWECVEMSGLAYCHSRGLMAGVGRGPRDLGWVCGPRRGSPDAEEICIDTDPDRPRDRRYRQCRYEQHMGATHRSCTPTRALIIGDACDQASGCPADSRCQAGLCLPERPAPACWFDRDCDAPERCALGSCVPRGA
jgi:hypothetical protein